MDSNNNLLILSEFVQKAVQGLPLRLRQVIVKRFNLSGTGRKTLEETGAEFKITRERVRQIEKDAFKKLAETNPQQIRQFEALFKEIINRYGGAIEQIFFAEKIIEYFKAKYPEKAGNPETEKQALALTLKLASGIKKNRETKKLKKLFYLNTESLKIAESAIENIVKIFEQENKPMKLSELLGKMKEAAIDAETLNSYIAISKEIAKNPYGETGLKKWTRISPRSARDKSYLALFHKNEPTHFREITQIISEAWPNAKRKVLSETVHNELIKDKRMVLVGRGIYALAEWGYERGTVLDAIKKVLQNAERPLAKEEIIKEVSKMRLVKPSTIILNLKNQEMFEKTKEGMYKLK